MKTLKHLITAIILTTMLTDLASQAVNDICTNAKTLDGSLFVYDSVYIGNSPTGVPVFIIGIINENTITAFSESPQISSNSCVGYINETNPEFVDIWYKKKTENSSYVANLPLYIYTSDTTHVSFYYGTCGNLFQHKCYTLLPGFHDTNLSDDFYYTQEILNDNDSLYIQISYPENSLPVDFTLIFGGNWSTGGVYYFNYDRPAIINNLTGINKIKQSEIQLIPNPTKGEFYIEAINDFSKLDVISLDGTLLKTYNDLNKKDSFSIGEFKNGLYILKIKFKDDSVHYERIIKI